MQKVFFLISDFFYIFYSRFSDNPQSSFFFAENTFLGDNGHRIKFFFFFENFNAFN